MKYLLLVILLLWLALWFRAHNVLELPLFVDESLHIQRGQVVWSLSDLGESLNLKKLLYYYWIGLFGLNAPESAWLARTATALFALIGAALTTAMARRLFNRWAGLLALALYAIAPFMVFFERVALADAFTATFCLAVAHASLGLARHPTLKRGVLVGTLIGLAALAKLIALPVALLPLLAIVLFSPSSSGLVKEGAGGWGGLRPYRRSLIAAALMIGVVLAPSLGYALIREITGTKDRVMVEESLYVTDDRAGQIVDNVEQVFRSVMTLFAPELLVLVGVLIAYLVWRKPRPLAYLLAAVLLLWGFVIGIAAALSTRYLVLGVPFLLVLVAGGTVDAAGWVASHRGAPIEPNWKAVQRLHWVAWAVLALWIVSFALPFDWDAMTDPVQLELPPRDVWEYFTNTSSGYALRDLAADLPDLPPDEDGRIAVIGFLPSCHSLPLYWTEPNAVDLDCPLFKWDTSKQQEMTDHLIGRAETKSVLYMAVDQTGVYDLEQLPFEWDLLAEYPRPHNGKVVRLYLVRMAE